MTDEGRNVSAARDAWIEEVLHDGKEMVWFADNISEEHPWDVTYIDVWVDIGDDAAAILVTISLEDEDDLWWPPDLMAIYASDPDGYEPYFDVVVVPAEDYENMEHYQRLAEIAERVPDVQWTGGPGWSVAAVNEALQTWIGSAYDTHVVPVCDLTHRPSPMLAAAIASLEAIKDGTADTYMIKPGVSEGATGPTIRASEQVMDWMLDIMREDDE